MEDEGVVTTVADQCRYGLMTRGEDGGMMPAKKKTRFMTNSQAIAEELGKNCEGGHQHQQLVGGRAADAARCPKVTSADPCPQKGRGPKTNRKQYFCFLVSFWTFNACANRDVPGVVQIEGAFTRQPLVTSLARVDPARF